ncbi:MAG: transposase [Dorea sp.]|jgi:putative transposase|nr:transposase [Dorea sp.]
MPPDKICKTIHQYNKVPISDGDMQKLLDIAQDFQKVKNYVYTRFGGIRSLSKLYPGYTVQNEMTGSGYRELLEMPAVYFYLAVFDALADIKSQWTRTKSRIVKLVNKNTDFTEDEKHYLRFILKVNNAFEQVVNQKPIELVTKLDKQYQELSRQVNEEKLRRYLCRQVRKYHVKLHTDTSDVFSISERAYRYAEHGIYISIKEKRKRVFVPLTDNNHYRCQLRIKLYPQENRIEIKVPINITVRSHIDFLNQVGLAVGYYTMLTTDEGHCYGKELGRYQSEYSDWVREQTNSYNRNKKDNPGRKKYQAKKRRLEERLHGYINQELNTFFSLEKPKTIYLVKLPKPQAGGYNKKINYSIGQWQRGYIRKRLEQKCKERSVEIIEVLGKDISNECSKCGSIGTKVKGKFVCSVCGYLIEEKVNTARNVKKRGQGEGKLY